MSVSARAPRAYRPGLWARLREGLRYGGGIGQWSWLAHRLTGLGILAFLIIHILDTFFVVAWPGLYDETVAIYGGQFWGGYYWPLRWGFRIGELGLIASVLFHSLNGLRIVLFDVVPAATRYQKTIFRVVMVVFVAIMVPVTAVVFYPLTRAADHWKLAPAAEAEPEPGLP